MTSPLIERVARALARSDVPEFSWDDLARGQSQYRKLARAAIEAMREPSEEQYDALCATNKIWRELNSYTVWTTYIDAALKGEG